MIGMMNTYDRTTIYTISSVIAHSGAPQLNSSKHRNLNKEKPDFFLEVGGAVRVDQTSTGHGADVVAT